MDKDWLLISWTKQPWIDFIDRSLLRNPPDPKAVIEHYVLHRVKDKPLPARFTMEASARSARLHYSETPEVRAFNDGAPNEWAPGTLHLHFHDDRFNELADITWTHEGQDVEVDPWEEVNVEDQVTGKYRPGAHKALRAMRSVAQRDSGSRPKQFEKCV